MSELKKLPGPAGEIVVHLDGDAGAPAVLMTHSILSAPMMWEAQAALLAKRGLRVIRAATRGHGGSSPGTAPCSMDDLGADALAVLDALNIERAHYIGLSLGGMSGFGLGIHHADRLLSLVLCACRADAPPPVAAPWDERIAIARAQGCVALADSTLERWFGAPFLQAHADTAARFRQAAANVDAEGFAACAVAIKGLDYIADVGRITTPTTFIVGSKDGVLPQAMAELQPRIAGCVLELIDDAGHLPNIDQPVAFDAALARHFDRVSGAL